LKKDEKLKKFNMELEQILTYLGYLASIIIVISMTMTSLTRIRIINSIGAALFSAYGFICASVIDASAMPVGILNSFILIVNMIQLYRLKHKQANFNLVQTSVKGEFIESFIKLYYKQIKKFQPEFNFELSNYDIALLTLRNMNIAGVIIGKKSEDKTLEINLDFVLPQYRDMKVGMFVFVSNKQYFKEKGCARIVTKKGNQQHENYLKKVGFLKCDDYYDIKL